MDNYLKSNYILEKGISIGEIPAILFRPKGIEEPIPSIVLYHGWSSKKEFQRMRGFILASVGYQVIIPDAIYHGERAPLDDYSIENAKRLFWPVVFNNIKEYPKISNEIINKYNADPEKIAVMGHSMGGFTAAGVFTHNQNIKSLAVLNGSCGWELFNEEVKETFNNIDEEIIEIEEKVNTLDPINNMYKLKDRPILLIHGDKDSLVPIKSQRIFYKKAKEAYNKKDRIKFIEYENLNHFVTTNMMEEVIIWFHKYL